MRLDGRIALVTGASRGIGRAIAIELGAAGARVGVHFGASRAEAEATLAAVEKVGGAGFLIQADLGTATASFGLARRFLDETRARSGAGTFDILVNNAGIGRRASIEEIDEDEFDRIVAVNLKAPFFLIQALLPSLRRGGRIINISSMGTRAAYPTMPVYAPSKAALEALTRSLAVHLGPRRITVNAVLPGATATGMNRAASDPQQAEAIAQTIALGRVGQPEDVARIVAFLASDAAAWVTGQSIDASGGQRL